MGFVKKFNLKNMGIFSEFSSVIFEKNRLINENVLEIFDGQILKKIRKVIHF